MKAAFGGWSYGRDLCRMTFVHPFELIHHHLALALHDCCTVTSTADKLAWQGTQPTVLQRFLRYSVEIYMYTNASELIS